MDQIAKAVLDALGGRANVLTNTVCMTRLRVTLKAPQDVDYDALNNVPSVLGTATRGSNGLEVVFGPRVIDGIYHAFLRLTGLEAGTDALFPMSRQESNFRVQINTKPRVQQPAREEGWGSDHLDEGDIQTLMNLFADDDADEPSLEADVAEPELTEVVREPRHLLVINGPNVNMIGLGTMQHTEIADFSAILELCKKTAQQTGFARCVCLQSNHEGDLVDWVQDAWGSYDAIVINPTSYGPTSVALREAIRSVGIPTARVGISTEHEALQLDAACTQSVVGKGIDGYAIAIRALADICMA